MAMALIIDLARPTWQFYYLLRYGAFMLALLSQHIMEEKSASGSDSIQSNQARASFSDQMGKGTK
ncbi:uncharacterized protein RSE6_12759 [Rhynchosporium secalis]|uniref:Uncharacterized protein n=1 Tax=Rhynchosporium secalis TaxID=38038 RepID=A0A1E1MR89_RHYSE|nr:uncharacterized protein RSE6_12759 [Rhynchosporium secalis]